MSRKQQTGSQEPNRSFAIMRCLRCGGIVATGVENGVTIWFCKGKRQKNGQWAGACGLKVTWVPGRPPKQVPPAKGEQSADP